MTQTTETQEIKQLPVSNSEAMADLLLAAIKEDDLLEINGTYKERPVTEKGHDVIAIIITGPFVVINIVETPEYQGIDVFVNPLNDAASTAYLMTKMVALFPDCTVNVRGVCAPIIDQNVISYDPEVVYKEYNRIMGMVGNILLEDVKKFDQSKEPTAESNPE